MAWADVTLCTDADVVGHESTWLKWTDDPDAWRAKAKREIEKRLRFVLRERELLTEAAEVLDLIGNPEIFQDAACYKALELCANDNATNPQDMWTVKAKRYEGLFKAEFDQAVEMMEFDEDESGDIDDSEKYKVSGAVRFGRGANLTDIEEDEEP